MKKLILFTLFLSFCSFFNYSKLKAIEINCDSPVWKNRDKCKVKYPIKKEVKELNNSSEEDEIWGNFLNKMNN